MSGGIRRRRLSVAIGQGYVTVTPLQLAQLAAEVANGGTLYKPQFVKQIDALDGTVVQDVSAGRRESHAHRSAGARRDPQCDVRRGRRVGRHRPRRPRSTASTYAGKTGTAQVVKEAQGARTKETALPEKYRDHGWFMAFAPADHPKIAIACIIEHAGHGGSAAGPVVKAVMEKYFEMNPPQGAPAARRRIRRSRAGRIRWRTSEWSPTQILRA